MARYGAHRSIRSHPYAAHCLQRVIPMKHGDRLPLITTCAMLAALVMSVVVYYAFNSPVLLPVAFTVAGANLAFVLWHRRKTVVRASPDNCQRNNRIPRWIVALVLLMPAAYVLGAPVTVAALQRYFPAAMPIAAVVYGPLRYYAQHPELPGSELFRSYAQSIERLMQ